MMTSAHVVETSVTITDNSPSQDYTHPDDQTTLLQVLNIISSLYIVFIYGSSSVCVSDCFFPFSIFLVVFRGWHGILKEIEESSSRHGIAVTSSRRGSVIGYFLNRSIFGGRDNFVISLPSSTAHFN